MALPRMVQPSTYEHALELFRLLSEEERQNFLQQIVQEGLVVVRAVFNVPKTPESSDRSSDNGDDNDNILPLLFEAMPYNFSGGIVPPKGSKWNSSTPARGLVACAGIWEGDDLDECLEDVYATRQPLEWEEHDSLPS